MEKLAFDFYSHVKEMKKTLQTLYDLKKYGSKEYREMQDEYRELHGKYFEPNKKALHQQGN